MFASYRVVHLAHGQLLIRADGGNVLISPFFWMALVSCVFFVYRVYKARSAFPLLGLLIWSLPWGVAAALFCRDGSLLLDRSNDNATFRQPAYLWHHTGTVPLHQLRYADLRFGRSSSRVAVIFVNGSAAAFQDLSDAKGQGEAVQAINDYLSVRGR